MKTQIDQWERKGQGVNAEERKRALFPHSVSHAHGKLHLMGFRKKTNGIKVKRLLHADWSGAWARWASHFAKRGGRSQERTLNADSLTR